MGTPTELKLSFDIAEFGGIQNAMTNDQPTDSPKALPSIKGLASCYEISETAIAKMMRKYNFSRYDLVSTDEVYTKLVRVGDRRGAIVRRLSDPSIRESIFEAILNLDWEKQ